MTQLLEEAIKEIQLLPEDQQDVLAHRILARLEEDRCKEARLLADLDEGLAQLDAGQHSEWDKEAFLKEAERRGTPR